MLSRKQLEDAAKCDDEGEMMCTDCSCDGGSEHACNTTVKAAETALALADMLKRLEWVKCPGHEDILFCPHCGALQMYGHTKDCELAALLKGLGEG